MGKGELFFKKPQQSQANQQQADHKKENTRISYGVIEPLTHQQGLEIANSFLNPQKSLSGLILHIAVVST